MNPFTHRIRVRATLLLALTLVASATTHAEDTAYLTLVVNGTAISDGASTPESLGARAQPAHPDEILVISHGSRGLVPTGTGGLPTGNLGFEPLRIRKFVDRSTPLIAKAMGRNETVEEAVLRLYRTAADGTREHALTIRLESGRIVDQSIVMNRAADGSAEHVESLAIAFQRITWTFEPLGIEYTHTVLPGA